MSFIEPTKIVDEIYIKNGIENKRIMIADVPLSKEFYGKIFVISNHSDGSKSYGRVFLKDETYGGMSFSKQSRVGKISRKNALPKKGEHFQFKNTYTNNVETIEIKLAYYDKERAVIYLEAENDVIYEMDFNPALEENSALLTETSKEVPAVIMHEEETVSEDIRTSDISSGELETRESKEKKPYPSHESPIPSATSQGTTGQSEAVQQESDFSDIPEHMVCDSKSEHENEGSKYGEKVLEELPESELQKISEIEPLGEASKIYSQGGRHIDIGKKVASKETINTQTINFTAGTDYVVHWNGDGEKKQFDISKHTDSVHIQISGENINVVIQDTENKMFYWPDSSAPENIRFHIFDGKVEIAFSGEFGIAESKGEEAHLPNKSSVSSETSKNTIRHDEVTQQETNWVDIPEYMICDFESEQQTKRYEHFQYWKAELKDLPEAELQKISEIKPFGEVNQKYPSGGSLANSQKKLAFEEALNTKISAAKHIIDKRKSLLIIEEVEDVLAINNEAELSKVLSTLDTAELLQTIEGDEKELIEIRHVQIEKDLRELNSDENLLFLCGYTEQVISIKLAKRNTAAEIQKTKVIAKELYLKKVNNFLDVLLDEVKKLPDARALDDRLDYLGSAQDKIKEFAPDQEELLERMEEVFCSVKEGLVKRSNEIINSEIKQAEAFIEQSDDLLDSWRSVNKGLAQMTKELIDRSSIKECISENFLNYPEVVDTFERLYDRYTSILAKKLRKEINGFSDLEVSTAELRDDYRQKQDVELVAILTDPMLPTKYTTHSASEWDKWSEIYRQQITIAQQVLEERGKFDAEKVAKETKEMAEKIESEKKAKEASENERIENLQLTAENLCQHPSKRFTSDAFFSKQLSENDREVVYEFIALKSPYSSRKAVEIEGQDNLYKFKDKVKDLTLRVDGYVTISYILNTGRRIHFTHDKKQGFQHAHTNDSSVLLSQTKNDAFKNVKSLISDKIRREQQISVNNLIAYFKEARYND